MRARRVLIGICLACLVGFARPGNADCPALAGRWPYAPVQAVSAFGTTVYLGSEATLVVLDASNPGAPAALGSLLLPGTIQTIAVSGGNAFVAAGNSGLRIVNVADPAHPIEVGHVDAPAYDVAVSGNRVFLASGDLRIYDASNPAAPVQLGTWGTGPNGTTGQRISLVAVSGEYAYVGWNLSDYGGFASAVIRVSDASHPFEVSRTNFPGLDTPVLTDIEVVGNLLLETFAGTSGPGLTIANISNPSAPVALGCYCNPSAPVGNGCMGCYTGPAPYARAVAASGGFAFLAEERGLSVVSIADPARPSRVASFQTADLSVDVAVAGSWVYVADRQGGLWLFDTSACGASGCSLACAPSVPNTATAGAPVVFQGSYLQSNCGGTPTFDWDFGDGSPHSSEQNPSHTYAFGGDLRWTLSVGLGGATCTTSGTIHVASTLPPISNPGSFAYLVATSAHKDGYNGTHWATDLVITNPGLAGTVVRLYFMKGWQDNSGSAAHPVIVPLRRSLKLVDVVQTKFLENSASGAILVGADVPLIVTSRTYNLTESGSYGQYVEGFPLVQAVPSGQAAWLVQLSQSAVSTIGFRANVGVVNVTGQHVRVDIALYAGDGVWLGDKTVELNPFDFQQLDRIFTAVAPTGVDNGYALLSTSTQGGRFLAYASVIDNQTGDPIAVPARIPPSGP
ncbi:MAG: PKD domain-containing protein [Thermoanaerobaculaceae bacterium]|nr:PKD domain-containing protein [Thermoanaerobaculaceae bacterium]